MEPTKTFFPQIIYLAHVKKKLFQLHFARLSNKLIDVQNTPSAYWLTLKSCNQSQKDTMHSFSALPENKLEKTEIILWWC